MLMAKGKDSVRRSESAKGCRNLFVAADGGTALLGIHMPRNLVVSMVRLLFSVNMGNITNFKGRSFSVLGMAPGVIVTIAVAMSVQYTSLILWRFCLRHPEIRDVCDIGKMLFGGSEIAYNITAVFFILNNTFIQGKQRR